MPVLQAGEPVRVSGEVEQIRDVGQSGRPLGLGPRRREFKSLHPESLRVV